MFKLKQDKKYVKAKKYLARIQEPVKASTLDKYGERGVSALMEATPVDTGKTKYSWYYKIVEENGRLSIQFCNSNVADYVPIAIILQYGHGTGTGGWVEGRDYINPALAPIFNSIAEDAWKEITR